MRLSLYPGHAIRLLLIDITFSVCDIDITCFDKYLKNGSHNRSSFLIAVSGENRKYAGTLRQYIFYVLIIHIGMCDEAGDVSGKGSL